MRQASRIAAPLLAALLAASCAHAPRSATVDHAAPQAPEVDSVTVGLWHMDETGGSRVADAGPYRLEASAGVETRTDFGRYRGARFFTRSMDSFVFVPYTPLMDPAGPFTVEAWVRPTAYGPYELTVIAGRWNQLANQQSWLLAIAGRDLRGAAAALPSPGFFDALLTGSHALGHVLFAIQPDQADAPRSFSSTAALELDKWTHVAASLDGDVVRIFVEGRLDAQYALHARIRASIAPLMLGNVIEPRRLTDFGGDLRVNPNGDNNPYYAYEGYLDELRISSAARGDFPSTRLR